MPPMTTPMSAPLPLFQKSGSVICRLSVTLCILQLLILIFRLHNIPANDAHLQVTLPALKDSVHIGAATLFVVALAVTSLPVLLTAEQDPKSAGTSSVVRYAVGAMAICLTLAVTVTLLFLPKVSQSDLLIYSLSQACLKNKDALT